MSNNTVITVDEIAEIAYEINREYSRAIGDDTKPSWSNASQDIRNSVLAGVRMHLDCPMTAQESHEAWMGYKEQAGWTYGEEIDFGKKTHPNLVKFDDLPTEQKAKDNIFAAVVANLARYVVRGIQ